jgi:predicted RNase H-like HicB family nuclease
VEVQNSEKKLKNFMKYTIIIEKGKTSYGAYVPDLPGCVAVAETEKEVKELIKEAIEFHLESLKNDKKRIPHIKTRALEMEVAV